MDKERIKLKRVLVIGSIVGGLLSVTISLLMDYLFADALQGTWRDAIANDLNRLFSINASPDSIIVYILFGIILLVLFGIGAILGSLFSLLIYRFFKFLEGPVK